MRPLIVGHRGAAGIAPENTLTSFSAALASGAEWVELDVRFSADGVPVVLHDSTLDRTTDGRGAVSELPFNELRRYDAGGWFAAEFRGERVPSLEEVLRLLAGRAGANIEVKDCGGQTEAAMRRILGEAALTLSRRPEWPATLLVSSFDESVVAAAARLGAPAGLLVRRGVRDPAGSALEAGARAVVVSTRLATERRLARVREAGLEIWAYTINNRRSFDRAAAGGFAAVIGDRPDRLRAWRNRAR